MKTKDAIRLSPRPVYPGDPPDPRPGRVVDLAHLLGVKYQSVRKWGEDLPPKRELQLRLLKPEWFENPSKTKEKK